MHNFLKFSPVPYLYWEYQAILSGGTNYTTYILNIIWNIKSPNTWKQFIDLYKSSPTYGTLKILHKNKSYIKTHNSSYGHVNHSEKQKHWDGSFCWFLLNNSAVLHDNTRQSRVQLWHLLLGKAVFLEGSLLKEKDWLPVDLTQTD